MKTTATRIAQYVLPMTRVHRITGAILHYVAITRVISGPLGRKSAMRLAAADLEGLDSIEVHSLRRVGTRLWLADGEPSRKRDIIM